MMRKWLNHMLFTAGLKRFGVKIAHHEVFDRHSEFLVEPDVIVHDCHVSSPPGAVATIGTHTYFRAHSQLRFQAFGRYCSVAQEVRMGDSQHDMSLLSTSPFGPRGQMQRQPARPLPVVGHDVWIGARVIIMNGVSIGHGAVIGAGSVVTRSVEPYSIVGGVPARVIRKRFPDEIIQELLALQWWDYDPADLARLEFMDVADFIRKLKQSGFKRWDAPRLHLNRADYTLSRD